jgi:hypothetical protein
MPLLEVEAKKLSNNDLIRGIVEEIIDTDELFNFLPFVKTEGKAYVYNREGTLASAQFIVPNVDVPESASTFTEVSVTLRIIAGDVDVDNFIATAYGDTNEQKPLQIALKAKAVARLFSEKLIKGDSSTAYNLSSLGGGSSVTSVEFDGLDVLCQSPYDYNIASNGDTVDFDALDELLDKVKLGAQALVMSQRTIRDFRKLCRGVSNVTPEYIKSPSGQNLLAYSGKPILRNDFIADNLTVGTATSVCSSIYAVRMNETDGVHGLYTGNSVGMEVIEIGQLEKRDATRTRIRWYTGLALKATHALAILRGIKAA